MVKQRAVSKDNDTAIELNSLWYVNNMLILISKSIFKPKLQPWKFVKLSTWFPVFYNSLQKVNSSVADP